MNHARHIPLYLATTTELKTEDTGSWNYLKDTFSINKSGILFCFIGSDHAVENKAMILNGGVIGLMQNQAALYCFCLITPFLSALFKDFCNKNQIKTEDYSQHYQMTGLTNQRSQHYQMTGLTNQRISNNVKKIIQVYHTFSLDFKDNASVFNAVSKSALPTETATNILSHEDLGKEMYQSLGRRKNQRSGFNLVNDEKTQLEKRS